jgi:hypothetical protein
MWTFLMVFVHPVRLLVEGYTAQVVQHPFHAEVVFLVVSQLQDVLD